MPDTRDEIRQERYRELRSLGYSPAEARRRRDWSGGRIEQSIQTTRRNISRIPTRRRTPEQQRQLEAIRNFRREESVRVVERGEIRTRRERLDDFRRWSGSRRFPQDAVDYITRQNIERGRDPLDSLGFRIFYQRYVNQVGEIEAVARGHSGEARDT